MPKSSIKPIKLEKETRDIMVFFDQISGGGYRARFVNEGEFNEEGISVNPETTALMQSYPGRSVSEAIGRLVRSVNFQFTMDIKIHGYKYNKLCKLEEIDER